MKGLKQFQEDCKKAHPYEHSGIIFLDKNDQWNVVSVITHPKDWDGDGYPEGFEPNKTDWYRKKREILKNGGVPIGVIHSHPVLDEVKEAPIEYKFTTVKESSHPSEMDLKLQRKFKHLVRGIVVCDKTRIFKTRFHDVRDKTVKPNTCPLCGARLK